MGKPLRFKDEVVFFCMFKIVENIFKKHLESFFKETGQVEANLNIVTLFTRHGYEKLKNDFPVKNYDLYDMGIYFRDFSQIEGGDNLYSTNVGYTLSTNNIDSEYDRLTNYISCLTITQAFEIFESFLKNILASLIIEKPELAKTLGISIEFLDFSTVRKNLYQIQGTSNKGFFKALRKISPFYNKHETDNIWKRNMSRMFDVIADVRNLIIHSRLIITEAFINKQQDSELKKLFNLYFEVKEAKNVKTLSISRNRQNEIISDLIGLAHLIYKSLSIDFEQSLDTKFKDESLK